MIFTKACLIILLFFIAGLIPVATYHILYSVLNRYISSKDASCIISLMVSLLVLGLVIDLTCYIFGVTFK